MQSLPQETNYKQTVVPYQSTILATESLSSIVSCGGMQIVAIRTDANWTTSDLRIKVGLLQDGSDLQDFSLFDGTTLAPFIIPGLPSSTPISLVPYWLCAYRYIQFNSSSATQVSDTSITVFLQPIFQGIHG